MSGSIEDLLRQYISLGDVPEEELARVGFRRVLVDGAVSVVREDLAPGYLSKLVKGPKTGPFAIVPLTFHSSEASFGILRGQQLTLARKYFKQLEELEGRFSANACSILAEHHPVHRFSASFRQYISRTDPANEVLLADILSLETEDTTAYDFSNYAFPIPHQISPETMNLFSTLPYDRKAARELFDMLERDRGRLADREMFKVRVDAMFMEHEHYTIAAEVLEESDSYNPTGDLATFLKREGTTVFDVYQAYLTGFLGSMNFGELAERVSGARHIDDLRAVVSAATPPSKSLEHQLRGRMKGATLEEQKRLSAKLREAKEVAKVEQQIIAGLAAHLSIHDIYADAYDRHIRKLQETISNKRAVAERTYSLDGRPDPERDENPGALSGDCTEGKPLPFYRRDTHNIKVFDEEKEHIGNIYLLETALQKPAVPAWHLDAIQIPKHGKWDENIASLIDTLRIAAQPAGIRAITVNLKNAHISNYNYIGSAAIRYHQQHGKRYGRIAKPAVPQSESDQYSDFQGSSHVRVLWIDE